MRYICYDTYLTFSGNAITGNASTMLSEILAGNAKFVVCGFGINLRSANFAGEPACLIACLLGLTLQILNEHIKIVWC